MPFACHGRASTLVCVHRSMLAPVTRELLVSYATFAQKIRRRYKICVNVTANFTVKLPCSYRAITVQYRD